MAHRYREAKAVGFPSEETDLYPQIHQTFPAASEPRLKGHRRFLNRAFLTSHCTLGRCFKRPAEKA